MFKCVFAFYYKLASRCRQHLFVVLLLNFSGCALFTEKPSPAEMMLPKEQAENGIITPEKPRFDDLPIGSIQKTSAIEISFSSDSNTKKPATLTSDEWLSLKDGLLLAVEQQSTQDSIEWNALATSTGGKITRLNNFGQCRRLIFSIVKTNKDYWYETTLCKNNTKHYVINQMKPWL